MLLQCLITAYLLTLSLAAQCDPMGSPPTFPYGDDCIVCNLFNQPGRSLVVGDQYHPTATSAFISAIARNDTECVNVLVGFSEEESQAKKIDIAVADSEGTNTVMYAAQTGQGQLAQWLISRGVAVDATDSKGRTALFYAVDADLQYPIAALLASGADVNYRDAAGDSAIMLARQRSVAVVQQLLDAHAILCFADRRATDGVDEDVAAMIREAVPGSPVEPGYYLSNSSTCAVELCAFGHYCLGALTDMEIRWNIQIPCPSGTYNALEGQVTLGSCLPCPDALFSKQGATRCQSCPQHTGVLPDHNGCRPDDGYYSEGDSTRAENIRVCPPGSFCRNGGRGLCPRGQAQPQPQQSACVPCAPGSTASTAGLTECSICPANTYQSRSGQSRCIICPEDATSDVGATVCRAPPGYYILPGSPDSLQPCGRGTYNSRSGMEDSAACVKCSEGFYTARTVDGQSRPAEIAATSCAPCPAGHRCPSGSSAPERCAGRLYQPKPGKNECLQCFSDSPSDIISDSTSCAFCDEGAYADHSSVVVRCQPCAEIDQTTNLYCKYTQGSVNGVKQFYHQLAACPTGSYLRSDYVCVRCGVDYACDGTRTPPRWHFVPTFDLGCASGIISLVVAVALLALIGACAVLTCLWWRRVLRVPGFFHRLFRSSYDRISSNCD